MKKTDISEQIISYQLNKLIVPFSYNKDYSLMLNKLCKQNENSSYWHDEDLDTDRLFHHISKLIHFNDEWEETIGRRFVITDEGRAKLELPTKDQLVYLIHKRKKPEYYYLCIKQVELFLFETQVGFIAYELEHLDNPQDNEAGYPYQHLKKVPDLSVDTIINANYFAKSFKRKNDLDTYYYEKKGTNQKGFRLASITSKIIDDFDVDSFFEHEAKSNENTASNALVYSALVLGKPFIREGDSQEKLGKYLYYMRRAFKPSYKPAPREFELEKNPNIMQFFANSYWGISMEGLTNIVYLIEDDDVTNNFMLSGYTHNLENAYFYIYILALNQRYTLLRFFGQVGSPTGNNIIKSRQHIARFWLRSLFRQVSNVDHQDHLYKRIHKVLGIEDLLEELHSELGLLADLSLIQEQQQESIFQGRVMILSTIFVGISTAQSVWTMYTYYKGNLFPILFSWHFWLFFAALFIIIMGTGIWGYKVFKQLKNKGNDQFKRDNDIFNRPYQNTTRETLGG